MPYELSFTRTFFFEAGALSKEYFHRLSVKLDVLREDPASAHGDAKKVKGSRNVYRVRVGDYRVFYTFGGGWVKLLGVRKRDEHTYDDDGFSTVDRPDGAPDAALLEPQELLPPPDYSAVSAGPAPPTLPATDLPTPLTAELLVQLQIPEDYHAVVTAVRTADDLLELPIPGSYAERILDFLYPPAITDLEHEPAFVLPNSGDLERFAEESLSAFLLRLSPEQEALRSFGDNGPALVKGGPGTGKSTLALYRIERLYRRGVGSILFTTYTNALLNYSEGLLTYLLGQSPKDCGVTISTVNSLALSSYRRAHPDTTLASDGEAQDALREALATAEIVGSNAFDTRARQEAIRRFEPAYLLQEFDTVIDAWELTSATQYREHPRRGRLTPIRGPVREAVWAVYERWRAVLRERKQATWGIVLREALVHARAQTTKPFAAVVIDEAQDLTPVALRFLLAQTTTPYFVYLTADASQSIYGRTFSWKAITADLNLNGRTVVLKRNFRNTAQILAACTSILADTEAGDVDTIVQEPSVHNGEVPTVALLSRKASLADTILSFFRQAALQWRLPVHSGAVLCPNKRIGRDIASGLVALGVPAAFLEPKEIDINATHIKVMTVYSAKGLEFPFVVVAGLDDDVFPLIREDVLAEETAGVIDEQRRLFFVGCSRAMRALMVCGSRAHPSPFLATLKPPTWQRQEVTGYAAS